MPALEDSCLDQSDADRFYISEENRRMKERLKAAAALIDLLEDNYDHLEYSNHWRQLRAIVGLDTPTTKSSG